MDNHYHIYQPEEITGLDLVNTYRLVEGSFEC